MSVVLPKVDTLIICELFLKKTWRVSISIDVRITMIRCVVYLLRIFKMFHGLMNNPVLTAFPLQQLLQERIAVFLEKSKLTVARL